MSFITMRVILASEGSHNKLPQTWPLKTMKICSLCYISQKSEIQVLAGLVLSGGSKRESIPHAARFSQFLVFADHP